MAQRISKGILIPGYTDHLYPLIESVTEDFLKTEQGAVIREIYNSNKRSQSLLAFRNRVRHNFSFKMKSQDLPIGTHEDYAHAHIQSDRTIITSRLPRTKAESPFAAAVEAAKLLYEKHGRDLRVCLSGGIDSVSMVQAFEASKVPYRIAVMRLSHGVNQHDLRNALRLCESIGKRPDFVEIDWLEYFAEKMHLRAAEDYHCPSPQLALHIEMLRKLEGVPVLAWQPVTYGPSFPVMQLPTEKYLSYSRYANKHNKEVVPFFFLYTIDLVSSFINTADRERDELVRFWQYPLKQAVYRVSGFPPFGPRCKYTGFELLRGLFDLVTGVPDAFNQSIRKRMELMAPTSSHAIALFPKEVDHDQ